MKKIILRMVTFFSVITISLILSGCIETRTKDVTTDGNGNADGIVSITQSAKISFVGYSCPKINCGSQISIQISFINKDVIKDNFVFVDKGIVIEDLKPVTVRSGDQAKIKITNGCPSAKYVITYNLDSGS
jgi:hypothetical protein